MKPAAPVTRMDFPSRDILVFSVIFDFFVFSVLYIFHIHVRGSDPINFWGAFCTPLGCRFRCTAGLF